MDLGFRDLLLLNVEAWRSCLGNFRPDAAGGSVVRLHGDLFFGDHFHLVGCRQKTGPMPWISNLTNVVRGSKSPSLLLSCQISERSTLIIAN